MVTARQPAARATYRQLEAERGRLVFDFGLLYLGFAVMLILAAIWLGLWFAERLARPVGRLAGAAQRVGAGDLDVQVQEDALILNTDRFARSVVLEGRTPDGDPFGWFFEDNWFDLVPGERKIVRVLGHHVEGQITARAW